MDEKFRHILVVDDNQINRQFLNTALTQAGHQVITAQDGQQALELSTYTNFDLVFMDIQMPGLNGIETTQQFKSIDGNSQTPVVAVSAETITELDSLCFAATMMKPLNLEDVFNIINQLCPTDALFNHNKALSTSHNDETIALKLRELFIQDLPSQLAKAKGFMRTGDIEELQSQLHYILGGAQVCAAEGLINLITELKHTLKNTETIDKNSEMLWQKIKVINLAMQNNKSH